MIPKDHKVPVQATRQCKRCTKYKSVDEFSLADSKTGRLRSYCKTCDSARVDAWAKSHKKERSAVYRRRHLKRTFGITEEQYESIKRIQDGKCAICGKDEKDARGGMLCVDHCHNSRKIRGLLCFECNIALGNFHDDLNILRRAAEYISGHQ